MNEEKNELNGIGLSRRLYHELIQPFLASHYPGLPHAAALLGPGSEVLGFDDQVSTDHDWGPRLILFLSEENHGKLAEEIDARLARHLPGQFYGYSTNFAPPDPNDNGTRLLAEAGDGPIQHRIELWTLDAYFRNYVGHGPAGPPHVTDWLTIPEQRLRTLTGGGVFRDEIGLQAARDHYAYYPRDIWLYCLAAGWTRLGQEDHLMGRAAQGGSELGSALIAARLVRDIMRLCFLMERTYAPYAKWFGRAFQQLACGPRLEATLAEVLAARHWKVREQHLIAAYEQLARMHNQLQITPFVAEHAVQFHTRAFRVIGELGIGGVIAREIEDPAVQLLLNRPVIGSIDQFSDNVDMLESLSLQEKIGAFYR